MRRILTLVGLFTGARGLDEMFDEVRGTIEDELDFRREADHGEEIAARFADVERLQLGGLLWPEAAGRLAGVTAGVRVRVPDEEGVAEVTLLTPNGDEEFLVLAQSRAPATFPLAASTEPSS